MTATAWQVDFEINGCVCTYAHVHVGLGFVVSM